MIKSKPLQLSAKLYHQQEAGRIQGELDNLGFGFAEDGIVRAVLRNRIEQENVRSRNAL